MKRLKPGKLLAVMLSVTMITACSSLTAAFADDGAAPAADTTTGQQEAQAVDDAQETSAVNTVNATVLKTEDPLTAAEDENGLTGEDDQNTDTDEDAVDEEEEPLHIGDDTDDEAAAKKVRVRGVVFDDYNFDAFYSKGENGVKGVTVGLYNTAGKKVATTTTDRNGEYVFDLSKKNGTSNNDGKSGHINLVTGGSYSVRILKKGADYVFPERYGRTEKMFPAYTLSYAKKYVNDKVVENESDSTGTTVRFSVNKASGTIRKNIGLEERPLSTTVAINWNTSARPDSVKMILSGDGHEKVVTLSAANGWKEEVTGLRRLDPDGNRIHYTVRVADAQNFTTSVTGDTDGGFVISASDSTASGGANAGGAAAGGAAGQTGYSNAGYSTGGVPSAVTTDTEIGEDSGSTETDGDIETPAGDLHVGDQDGTTEKTKSDKNSTVPYLIDIAIAAAVIAAVIALIRRRRHAN